MSSSTTTFNADVRQIPGHLHASIVRGDVVNMSDSLGENVLPIGPDP